MKKRVTNLPLEEQDQYQLALILRVFSKEELLDAREEGSSRYLDQKKVDAVVQAAGKAAEENGAWARSRTRTTGARNSLRAFLIGESVRFHQNTWECIEVGLLNFLGEVSSEITEPPQEVDLQEIDAVMVGYNLLLERNWKALSIHAMKEYQKIQ